MNYKLWSKYTRKIIGLAVQINLALPVVCKFVFLIWLTNFNSMSTWKDRILCTRLSCYVALVRIIWKLAPTCIRYPLRLGLQSEGLDWFLPGHPECWRVCSVIKEVVHALLIIVIFLLSSLLRSKCKLILSISWGKVIVIRSEEIMVNQADKMPVFVCSSLVRLILYPWQSASVLPWTIFEIVWIQTHEGIPRFYQPKMKGYFF